MATDNWNGDMGDITAPARKGAAVTPDDDNDLADVTRALWVGGAGAVKVDLADGDTVTLSGVQAGTLLPVRAKRVYATGTDATLIVALW